MGRFSSISTPINGDKPAAAPLMPHFAPFMAYSSAMRTPMIPQRKSSTIDLQT